MGQEWLGAFRWGLASVHLFDTNQTSIKSSITVWAQHFHPLLAFYCSAPGKLFNFCASVSPPLNNKISPGGINYTLVFVQEDARKALQELEIINKASKTLPPMLQQTTSPLDPRARCAALAQKAKKQKEAASFFIFMISLIKLNKTWRHVLCCCSCPFAQRASHKYFRERVQKICKIGPSLLQH